MLFRSAVDRAVFVLGAALAITGARLPSWAVGGIFAAAEAVLLPCLVMAVRPKWIRSARAHWMRTHLAFGGRGVVNGVLLEAHFRIDTLLLAVFVDDRAIGAYAFAMLFAEAVYQVPVVIRTVAYPTLVRLAAAGAKAPLARAVRRVSLAGGVMGAAAAAAVLIGYPLLAAWFAPAFLDEGVRVLKPLLLGMTAYAFFVPFDQLLLQSGLPGRQSLLTTLYVLVNVTLNLLLIPRLGLRGAAIATAIALASAGVMLLAASWRWLGFRHGVLFYSEGTA